MSQRVKPGGDAPQAPDVVGRDAAPSRRRSEKSRTAIVGATRKLLMERGFDRLTIEAVAARAGVGKQTIYRWWPSRHALVADVILEDADKILRPIAAGTDLTADVCAWSTALATTLTTARGNAMLRILTIAGTEHPETATRLHAGFTTPLHATVRNRFASAGFGEEPARDAADAIVGGIVYAILSEGRTYDPRRAASITRTVIAGMFAQ
ncbi:AcrR family transcriptional regulator [Mycolicibacterium iranicum]|uniref:AcrR family transcriptional regulator n=1 Tax=Mycolicibacterium iranicum TaxID=912594 RepID=A0A839Q7I1_MYCIR|nr:TetR/AcrR family transcriptional regulator [Mycolicibacterium iranicum]MBB2991960.1 AcrR family transcriptional regulator [Mycolicibacterium iranicum]